MEWEILQGGLTRTQTSAKQGTPFLRNYKHCNARSVPQSGAQTIHSLTCQAVDGPVHTREPCQTSFLSRMGHLASMSWCHSTALGRIPLPFFFSFWFFCLRHPR